MDLESMPIEELRALVTEATTVLQVRAAAESAAERAAAEQEDSARRLDAIAASYHAAHGGIGTEAEPVPWVRPTGPHDSYPRGAAVTHAGQVWDNPAHPVNSWEPGAVGSPWVMRVQADPDTGHVAWAPGQQVYAAGGNPDDPDGPADERTHDGRLWGCKFTHVTHEGWVPSVHTHAVWEDRGPV